MNDTAAKQQIVERIKKSTNILVTLGKNPSVDELSAALGLSLMLNKLDKHATAVFSGVVPPAIEFLEPSKTFENTVDSLRDFIIALDKEKADRLRYRVEDDMVRIFITPYRTRITQEDLKFTHGDFNVELVLALGVEKQADLDDGIAAHGKILHDATVVSITNGNAKSSFGSIEWQDTKASSLCEMLVAMSESLQGGLLDQQISTALLTGIVAATDRFSNNQTSSKSMTMAAQLMAAGANQQLIAAKLEETAEISPPQTTGQKSEPVEKDGSSPLDEGTSKRIRSKKKPDESSQKKQSAQSLGEVTIEHSPHEPAKNEPPKQETQTDDAPAQAQEPAKPPYVPSGTIEEHDRYNKKLAGEQALDEALAEINGNSASSLTTQPNLSYIETGAQDQTSQKPEPVPDDDLFATPSGDEEDGAVRQEEFERNKTTLSHGAATGSYEQAEVAPANHEETLSELEDHLKNQPLPSAAPDHPDQLRQEIDTIFDGGQPSAVADATPSPDRSAQAASLLPPLPDFSNLPPLPPNVTAPDSAQTSPNTSNANLPPPPPTPADPGQFRIPGQ